jgi:K+-sensing histidine kinase KdpD
LLEISGHPSWAVLLLIIAAVTPSILLLFYDLGQSRRRSQRWRRSNWIKAVVVLAMVGITVVTCLAFDFNPRVAYYLPLLAPVLISAVLFGFGTSLFSVILGIVAADFFFAPPAFDFAITEWEDVLGLATFGIIGALLGLAIDEFFSFPD